jgi:drug/metabolite transporter (DMT)-like permease
MSNVEVEEAPAGSNPPPDLPLAAASESAAHRYDPAAYGVALCFISAVGYTIANIFLRHAAESCHPAWVSCVKAMPTCLIAWLIIAARARRGLPSLPSRAVLPALVAAALFMQVGGNVAFQWSLEWVGLALSMPLTFGTIILTGAFLGRAWLNEPITPRMATAMAVLIVAVVVISLGTRGDELLPHADADDAAFYVPLAIGAAAFSGISYGVSNVVIRKSAGAKTPVSASIMVMSTAGVVSLGIISLAEIGWQGMAATTPGQWQSMLLAGVFNSIAFFALGLALETTTVVKTNVLNASQVAMSAVAGMLLFGEQPGAWAVFGIALTVVGLMLVRQRRES